MFKKRSGVLSGLRRRRDSNDSASSEDGTVIVKKKKKCDASNPLVQRSCAHKSSKAQEIHSSSDSDEEVKSAFRSTRTAERVGPADMGATATLETETEKMKDAQAVFERSLEVNQNLKGQPDDCLYRGLNNYSHFFEKKGTAYGNAASGGVRKGPIRAPDHIRSTVRWDYQPDLCKDYKETGFCGFGDSCKFLHDRTDYKFGWQIELEANKVSKGFEEDSDENYEIPDNDDHLPFKCFICRQSFKDPVVTKCKHYFCEQCALGEFRKSKRCYVCGENTNGVFISAAELIAKLKGNQRTHSDDSSDE